MEGVEKIGVEGILVGISIGLWIEMEEKGI